MDSLILRNLLDMTNQQHALAWRPHAADGRSGAEIVRLYDARKEGKGPAAALLRYKPGATVPRHLHPGYELIFVLDGILTNDTGDHPPGTLEICPPGSAHALSSKSGCTFLVVWEEPVQVVQATQPVDGVADAQALRP
jgi:anti-sigma factor ChrR (cupin superfamily)